MINRLNRYFSTQPVSKAWVFGSFSRGEETPLSDVDQIDPQEVWTVIQDDLHPLLDQVNHYLSETDWDEWGKNESVIKETTAYKTLIQTAKRMKADNMPTTQISRYTGLTADEIESLL